MTVLDLLRALRRHPVVAVVLLIASLAAGFGVWSGIPTSYQADSSMVLLAPDTVVEGGKVIKVNPWERAGDQPSQVLASTIATVANSTSFLDGLTQQGVTSTTAVEVALSGGGVVLNLTTVNRSAAAASDDLQTLTRSVQSALTSRQRQVGAPSNSLLRGDVLTDPGPPVALTGSRVKLAGVTVVLALVLSVLVILMIEARLRRGRSRVRRPFPGFAGRDLGPAEPHWALDERFSSEETVTMERPSIAGAGSSY